MTTQDLDLVRNLRQRALWPTARTLGCAVFALTSCVAAPEDDRLPPDGTGDPESIARRTEAIIGGWLNEERPIADGSVDPDAIVAVKFVRNGVDYGCTGVLIASRWVATAAHCFTDLGYTQGYEGPPLPSVAMGVTLAARHSPGLAQYNEVVKSVHLHGCEAGNNCVVTTDFALIELTKRAGESVFGPSTVAPIPLMGSGTGTDGIPTATNIARYQGTSAAIAGYAPVNFRNERRWGIMSVRGTGSSGRFQLNPTATGHRFADGDSGGPVMFTNADGQAELAGVIAISDNQIADFASYVPRDFVNRLVCGHGWEFLGSHLDNYATAALDDVVRIGEDGEVCAHGKATGHPIVLVRKAGEMFLYKREPYRDGNAGHSWFQIDDAHPQVAYVDAPNLRVWRRGTGMVTLDSTGRVYKYDLDGRIYHHWYSRGQSWARIEADIWHNKKIATDGQYIYQIRENGEIRRLSNWVWTTVGNDPRASDIAANLFRVKFPFGGAYRVRGRLFKLHKKDRSNTLWAYDGCGGPSCWTQISGPNTKTEAITSNGGVLYVLTTDEVVWSWSPSGWAKYEDRVAIEPVQLQGVAGEGLIRLVRPSGRVVRFTGTYGGYQDLGQVSPTGARRIGGAVATLVSGFETRPDGSTYPGDIFGVPVPRFSGTYTLPPPSENSP